MTSETNLPLRSEVSEEQTWDLASIYPTPEAWEQAGLEISKQLPILSGYQGRLGESPQVLLEYINLFQEVATQVGMYMVYANNAYAVGTNDQAAAGRAGQSRSLMAHFGASTAFANPELMSIGFDKLRTWLKELPDLAFMAHYLGQLERRQAHVRTGEVEQVLAMVSDPFSGSFGTFNALSGADLTFEPATTADGSKLDVIQSSIGALLAHPDREVRRTAWENYADGYLRLKNTFASTLT